MSREPVPKPVDNRHIPCGPSWPSREPGAARRTTTLRGRRSIGYARCVTSDGPGPSGVSSDGPTTAGLSAGAKPARRARNVLPVVLGFVLALGTVAAGTAFYFYDRATAIDRSNPQVVAEQFLDSAMVLKDSNRLALFLCDSWSAAQATAAVAPPSDASVTVMWGDPSVQVTGSRATVTLRVQFSVAVVGGAIRDVQSWTLGLENSDGWRVCSLTKHGSINT